MSRLLPAALLLLVLLAVLGYCAWSTQPAGVPGIRLDHSRPHPQGDYLIHSAPEPRDLNPFTTTDNVARRMVLSYTHDALLKIDPDSGEPIPALADVERAEPDGRTFVMRLRPDVRFSDGEPLTMADVLFTWELARGGHDLPGSMWSDVKLIERVEQLDDQRLKLVLRDKHFTALGLAATGYLVVQKRFFTGAVADFAAEQGEAVPDGPKDPAFGRLLRGVSLPGPGTGPYRLARDAGTGELLWRRGVDLLMVQNEHSWRASAHPEFFNLAGVRLLFGGASGTQLGMLKSQELDWWEVASGADAMLEQHPDLAANYRAIGYGYLNLGPVFIVWNHRSETVAALSDPSVRTALTMLFDRPRLVELRGERALPAPSWFLPDRPREGDSVALLFDVEGARTLLADAGYADEPLRISILTIRVPEFEEIVDLAIPAFARAGIELRKTIVDPSKLRERLYDHDFEGAVWAWGPDVFNDPTEVFHSTEGIHNWMQYASSEMDEVLLEARAEMDPETRLAMYLRFNDIFHRDQPLTLLYHRRVSGLLHNRFQNVEVGAMGLSMRRWWVEPDDHRHHWGSR